MQFGSWSRRALAGVSFLTLAGASTTFAADITDPSDTTKASSTTDITAELKALKARIAELEAKENDNWLTDQRAEQIRGIVNDVLKDAKIRSQYADGDNIGYKDGFFIQTPDKNYRLVVGGYAQVRYEFAQSNATNGRTLPGRTVGSGANATTVIPPDPANSNGFSVRRARLNFSGNVVSPDLTFRLEGDFYGGTGGALTVTDAWIAYRFNDLLRVKAGSFKVPFAKAELQSDPLLTMIERPEVMAPFDPVRALGVSVYGDIIKDKLAYDVNVNDGSQTNTLRRTDTVGLTPNLDNRLAFYGRLQWAGNGKIADFVEEADMRPSSSNQDFVWLVGAAAGYESQNATNSAFPSPQTTGGLNGISNGNGPGFTNYTLNGDLFRATVDWSAKWQGLSLLTAAYFQQVNANPGNTSTTSGTTVTTGPYGPGDASFFQHAYYGQVGYFVIPQKLELVGRAGLLLTEGYPNAGEFYTAGANYYFYGNNLKIQSDVTFTPEAAYTDSAAGLLQNTSDIVFRLQLQAKF